MKDKAVLRICKSYSWGEKNEWKKYLVGETKLSSSASFWGVAWVVNGNEGLYL